MSRWLPYVWGGLNGVPLGIFDRLHEVPHGKVVLVEWEYSDRVLVWIEVPNLDIGPSYPTQHLRVYGTGHIVPTGAVHVGSVRQPDTEPEGLNLRLVWHVYSEAKR